MGDNSNSDNSLAILPTAPRRSKLDWEPVTGEVPPATADRLRRFCATRGLRRTDVIHRAIERFLEAEEPTLAAAA